MLKHKTQVSHMIESTLSRIEPPEFESTAGWNQPKVACSRRNSSQSWGRSQLQLVSSRWNSSQPQLVSSLRNSSRSQSQLISSRRNPSQPQDGISRNLYLAAATRDSRNSSQPQDRISRNSYSAAFQKLIFQQGFQILISTTMYFYLHLIFFS